MPPTTVGSTVGILEGEDVGSNVGMVGAAAGGTHKTTTCSSPLTFCRCTACGHSRANIFWSAETITTSRAEVVIHEDRLPNNRNQQSIAAIGRLQKNKKQNCKPAAPEAARLDHPTFVRELLEKQGNHLTTEQLDD